MCDQPGEGVRLVIGLVKQRQVRQFDRGYTLRKEADERKMVVLFLLLPCRLPTLTRRLWGLL